MKKTLYFAFFLSVTAMLVTGIAYAGYNWAEPIIAENRITTIDNNIMLSLYEINIFFKLIR